MNRHGQTSQYSLLRPAASAVRTLYLNRPKQFDELIEGYPRMMAVSYVASPVLMLSLFERHGYEKMEILVGDNASMKQYKKDLRDADIEKTLRLVDLVRSGKLMIYLPSRKVVHSKFYLLEKADHSRVIVGSANLSETARKAVRQENYVVYWDLPKNDPLLNLFLRDYRSHMKNAVLFMEDLLELLESREDEAPDSVIKSWLQDEDDLRSVEDTEVARTLREISQLVLENDAAGAEITNVEADQDAVYVVVPGSVRTQEALERQLRPVNPQISGKEMRISKSGYADFVRTTCRVPLMAVDRQKNRVLMRMDHENEILSAPPEDAVRVDEDLAYLESYIETFRHGETLDLERVQMNVFEAFLSFVSAPFAHEFKKLKMSVDRYTIGPRGPKYLYIYGPSYNGKTNFLRFCLKVVTGRDIEPVAQEHFKKTSILAAKQFVTVFPLAFDDVAINSAIEPVLKHYWEVWWNAPFPTPQIIMCSNQPNPKEWAETRIKRVNFDVKFDLGNPSGAEALSRVLESRTDFFRWFSHGYLAKLDAPSEGIRRNLIVDEVRAAREVVLDLYRLAGRRVPSYFPRQPVEQIYDVDRIEWLELIETQVLKVEVSGRKIVARAAEMIPAYEVERYLRVLPQSVKANRKGHKIIIEGKDNYLKWVAAGRENRSLWNRIRAVISRSHRKSGSLNA
jgi:hypothetical protein